MRSKISVIGAGFVGSTLVQRLAERDYADIVMFDIVPNMLQGKALDMLQAGPVLGYDSLMIMVTNPLDAMAQLALYVSHFPRERVIGMAGVLDTSRFRTFIAQELNVSVRDVQAYVLGGHGDTMVPLSRLCTVAGVPIDQLIPAERIEQIVQRTRDGGAEVVKLLGTGSAYFAPSASVLQMVDSIMLDKNMIMPCAVYLQGEYGINNLFVGVPAQLGAKGLEKVVEVELTASERSQLKKSAQAVKELVDVMGI